MEGDATEGSPKVMVLGERLALAPLTSSAAGGDAPAEASRRVGSAALEASGESSLALTSAGSGSPTWGAPLLQWMDPQDPASVSFTLDDAAKSMEWESLDLGVTTVLKALEHATSTLREVVVPSSQVFVRSCFLFSSSFIFCFLTTVS